ARLRVPEEIALIGVDDDPLRCRLSHPTLSSIHLNLQYAGFEAMRIAVEAVRSRNPSPVTPHTYLPAYIAERASSAGLASDDPTLNRAARYIQENFSQPIKAAEIVNASGVSRRTLETRFTTLLNYSILEYLQRTRIRHATMLACQTKLSISEISEQCGFLHSRHFCQYFKLITGETPRQYRAARSDLIYHSR
ncbi:MAG: helix-turn-helix domain-containing protein, partial [Verrucomicrobiota bacterium]